MIYICFGLLAFVVWREWEHDREIRAIMQNRGIEIPPIFGKKREYRVEKTKGTAV
jgi:hypothetical protein